MKKNELILKYKKEFDKQYNNQMQAWKDMDKKKNKDISLANFVSAGACMKLVEDFLNDLK